MAPAISAREFLEQPGEAPHDAARRFTDAIAAALRQVTLNLDAWEDLPILETAESLYALNKDEEASPERRQAFARGMALLREEQPERFERLKHQLADYRARLGLLSISSDDLTSQYRPGTVALFILRNLFAAALASAGAAGLRALRDSLLPAAARGEGGEAGGTTPSPP